MSDQNHEIENNALRQQIVGDIKQYFLNHLDSRKELEDEVDEDLETFQFTPERLKLMDVDIDKDIEFISKVIYGFNQIESKDEFDQIYQAWLEESVKGTGEMLETAHGESEREHMMANPIHNMVANATMIAVMLLQDPNFNYQTHVLDDEGELKGQEYITDIYKQSISG